MESVVNHSCHHFRFRTAPFIFQVPPIVAHGKFPHHKAQDRRWYFSGARIRPFAISMALRNMHNAPEDGSVAGLKTSHMQAGIVKDKRRFATGTLVTGMRYGEEGKACKYPNTTTDLAAVREEGAQAPPRGLKSAYLLHPQFCDHEDVDGGRQDARRGASSS